MAAGFGSVALITNFEAFNFCTTSFCMKLRYIFELCVMEEYKISVDAKIIPATMCQGLH